MTLSGSDAQAIGQSGRSRQFENFNASETETAASRELLADSGAWTKAGKQPGQRTDNAMDNLVALAPGGAGPRRAASDFGPTPAQRAEVADSADENFDNQIKKLQAAGRPAKEIAELYVKKAENHSDAALKNDVNTVAGKALYRDQLQKTIDNLNSAITVMSKEKGNADMGTRAQLVGDLAFWEMSRADVKGDKDAVNASKHFDEAIALWKKFDPTQYQNQDDINQATDLKDRSMLALWAQSIKLHTSTGDTEKRTAAEQQIRQLLKRRPELFRQDQ